MQDLAEAFATTEQRSSGKMAADNTPCQNGCQQYSHLGSATTRGSSPPCLSPDTLAPVAAGAIKGSSGRVHNGAGKGSDGMCQILSSGP